VKSLSSIALSVGGEFCECSDDLHLALLSRLLLDWMYSRPEGVEKVEVDVLEKSDGYGPWANKAIEDLPRGSIPYACS
jgi:hypothetical protein